MARPLSPMVVASLHDGLGNQLFQYAMGKALAQRLQVPLKLDLTGVIRHRTRPYGLDRFRIPAVAATDEEIDALCPKPSRLRRKLQRMGVLKRKQPRRAFFERYPYRFDAHVLTLEAPIYVDGYWQSLQYFEHLRAELLSELQVRPGVPPPNRALLDRIAQLDAVSVHVRRGDYVTHDNFQLLDADYYARAVDQIVQRVSSPTFVVFTDDPAWTRANLRLPEPVIWSFEHGPHDAVQDLQLMMACKHFITANSSFSFWPAWLGTAPGKTVVCPVRWFQNPEWSTVELREPDWLAV